MQPEFKNNSVIAFCPDCGAASSFAISGSVIPIAGPHEVNGVTYSRLVYALMYCLACSRGGLAKLYDNGNTISGVLESFFPNPHIEAKIPTDVPNEIASEYREAEQCMSFGAWRAASALPRSTLEKILKENGYKEGNLYKNIEAAFADNIITGARKNRAHDEIRVLGNDVLHDAWKQIPSDDVEASHHYVQRILEDFYDDRTSVENILKSKGRI